jgi:broad specificity phosphatase PhoE
MHKTLIIIRHAHRNKASKSPINGDRETDNGLSAKGIKQAEVAAKFYKKRFGKTRAKLLSSPKKRCIETLTPLSRLLRAEIEVDASLDEAQRVEDLQKGIARFTRRWAASSDPLTVISSHGDWIPEYLRAITGQPIELDKGGWVQIESDGDEQDWAGISPRLTWLIQDFDFF